MRKTARSLLLAVLTLLSALVLGVASTITTAGFSLAASTAYIMGGTGRPDPKDFPGYIDNVMDYYIEPTRRLRVAVNPFRYSPPRRFGRYMAG
jgi:hypothetical protein